MDDWVKSVFGRTPGEMQMYGMSGEKLGPIGPKADVEAKSSSWKEDFLSKPSVSIRKGIAWGTEPPFEDTDTVVLTAPSGEFVDVRFPKGTKDSREAATHSSFWAFSGTVQTTFHEGSTKQHAVDMPYIAHDKFTHYIDSRGDGIVDEGDMIFLPSGDCLEMGVMPNPATGKEQLYKEIWSSAKPLPGLDGVDDAKLCVVAHTVSPNSCKGIVIRLGGRLQAVLSQSHEGGKQTFEVERRVRGNDQSSGPVTAVIADDIPGGSWYCDIRSSGNMPVAWLCMQGRYVGQQLEHNGITWEVTEVHA